MRGPLAFGRGLCAIAVLSAMAVVAVEYEAGNPPAPAGTTVSAPNGTTPAR